VRFSVPDMIPLEFPLFEPESKCLLIPRGGVCTGPSFGSLADKGGPTDSILEFLTGSCCKEVVSE